MSKKMIKESTVWQIVAHAVMIIGSLLALLPFVLLVIASFTDNQTALVNGYSFTPEKWSLAAYEYIAAQWTTIGRAYVMTIVVTVVGTVLSLVITSAFAFAVSNDKLPGQKISYVFVYLYNALQRRYRGKLLYLFQCVPYPEYHMGSDHAKPSVKPL